MPEMKPYKAKPAGKPAPKGKPMPSKGGKKK